MMFANVYDYSQKEKPNDKEWIAWHHGIIFIPNSCIPVREEDPAVKPLMFGTTVKIESDHYYDLLVTVDTTDESIKHWCIEHVSQKGCIIISTGLSKDVLVQEMKRLENEGYLGYSTIATKNTFQEFNLNFV